MSWMWSKNTEEEGPPPVVEESNDGDSSRHTAASDLDQANDDDDDDDDNDDDNKEDSNNDNREELGPDNNDDQDDDDDGESSDESLSDEDDDNDCNDCNDDDDDDDDDDSLVVNLIESMASTNTTDDDDDDDDDDDHGEIDEKNNNGTANDDDIHVDIDEDIDGDEDSNTSNDIDNDNYDDDNDNDNDEDPVTSFWEKQSLLALAAEHDRVDILKTLLSDSDNDSDKQKPCEKDALLNTGIPPLHLAISFGSVNTAQSLLRMGSDPSVRPDIAKVVEQRNTQPKDSKVEIPQIHRFDNKTAWELAFGNALYNVCDERTAAATTTTTTTTALASRSSWSVFGSSSSTSAVPTTATATATETNENAATSTDTPTATATATATAAPAPAPAPTARTGLVVKPIDLPRSKLKGIRFAFTAEALRSVGSDEAHRLKQLLDSGMPADIDIGGKDLCGWAVDMGATKCHQLLLVSTSTNLAADENAHANENANANANANVQVNEDNAKPSDASMAPVAVEAPHCQEHNTPLTTTPSLSSPSPSFVVHRPNYDGDQETIPQLKNRLDELESLSLALSTCLDNLAEEVSVCNGLLLMGGGGASALASHVRSLRDWKQQKLDEIEKVNSECRDAERELADLVHSSNYKVNSNSNANANANANANGPPPVGIGNEGNDYDNDDNDNDNNDNDNDNDDPLKQQEAEAEILKTKAQIAASEHKIRKLRASIADLSEEKTRDLKEVQRRGLEGGVNLVRGLREELRDFDHYLSEARSAKAVCEAKIARILAQMSDNNNKNNKSASTAGGLDEARLATESTRTVGTTGDEGNGIDDHDDDHDDEILDDGAVLVASPSEIDASRLKQTSQQNGSNNDLPKVQASTSSSNSRPPEETESDSRGVRGDNDDNNAMNTTTTTTTTKSASQKIATGDSQAIAVLPSGSKGNGFFTVDLWEVLLRIIGYERAANRRTVAKSVNGNSNKAITFSTGRPTSSSDNISRSNVMII